LVHWQEVFPAEISLVVPKIEGLSDIWLHSVSLSIRNIIPEILLPVNYCKRYVLDKSQGRALIGPFKGMRYATQSRTSAYWPKLLGTYEKELHPTILQLSEQQYDNLLVIGAGEGHYAVGLTFILDAEKVIAFEIEESERALLAKTASENEVEVDIAGACTPQALKAFRSFRNFIIMDIEGEEDFFLQDGVILEMKHSTYIIEVHSEEFLRKGRDILSASFELDFLPVQPRTFQDFPLRLSFFHKLLKRYWKSLVQEWRSDSIGWLIAKPIA
jgi:hypothetical protein